MFVSTQEKGSKITKRKETMSKAFVITKESVLEEKFIESSVCYEGNVMPLCSLQLNKPVNPFLCY